MTSPFDPLVVIANQGSGRGKVRAHLVEIERILTGAGLSYRIVRTTHPGHATEAARDALDRGERYLVAVGGDGTVHEVLNGMIAGDRPVAEDAGSGSRPTRPWRSRRTGRSWAPRPRRSRSFPGPSASRCDRGPALRNQPGSRRSSP
jgi:hypothetical protein